MRILVYPHDLAMGGSQLNAIDLAAAVARRGHHVVVFGVPGPLVDRIVDLGLPFISCPTPRRRPSPAAMSALAEAVRVHDIDVVHGYEWPPGVEAHIVARRTGQVSMTTVMSMAVADFLPRSTPLVVGTRQIARVERDSGRKRVAVIEPPVDLDHDTPNTAALRAFEDRFELDRGEGRPLRIVTVTRLVPELKLEGLLVALDVIARLDRERRVQLIIVGDGSARGEVAERAERINRESGRRTVVLTGQLADPRPAYQSADVVLGMGGSALRAMAFAKPIVVQGEKGFWRLLDEGSVEMFGDQGWYGVGNARDTGMSNLLAALDPLLADADTRDRLGRFARAVVVDGFSLDRAADRQIDLYVTALERRSTRAIHAADAVRSTGLYARYFLGRTLARLRGSATVDDFNSVPVAATGQRAR